MLKKVKSETDYITLFGQVFKQQNPGANLASMFAGTGKTIKINDNDNQVLDQLRTIATGAIKQTYKILSTRVDQFGVAQANTNLEENKGIISVELPGVQDAERVRKLLQASAHLQFWEVYNISEISKNIEDADKALSQYIGGVSVDSIKTGPDSSKNKVDSSKLLANAHPLANVIHFIGPQQDKTGKPQYFAAIANIELKDTSKANEFLNLDIVKNNFPANLKFLYGLQERMIKQIASIFSYMR